METGGRAGAANSPRPIAVIKLGGSVLTRKREVEKLRPKVLARLSEAVVGVTTHRVILLHGAGGFGHPGAARFALAQPPSADHPPSERARGASIVSAEVRRLHLAVLRELVRAGGRPWSIPIANHCRQTEGRLAEVDLSAFSLALDSGFIPVSFGDVVPDSAWGTSILSADTIALALAKAFHPERVVFVSDVPGIYAPGPGNRRTVAPSVTDSLIASLAPRAGAIDVTGGIRGKAETMRAIARLGVNAGLISGLSDGAIPRALRGTGDDGSWARAEPGATG